MVRSSNSSSMKEVNAVQPSPAFARSSYDVFLSFRGSDTRKNFTDFLYITLTKAGIIVFKDDHDLPIGEEIHPQLVEAIKRSKVSIPIFSKDYASSRSCLMEVVQMLQERRTGKHKIVPIFFDVGPSVVKDQGGTFHDSFEKHKLDGVDPQRVRAWRRALREVAELSGLELDKTCNGYQGQFAEAVLEHVYNELKQAELHIPDNLVGVEDRVQEIMRKVDVNARDVRVIGLHGIGGIGKTTIAKVIYNHICHGYDACSFVENIRETVSNGSTSLRSLQNQLISDLLRGRKPFVPLSSVDRCTQFMKDRFVKMKVLIFLDDLDEEEQLEAFVGENWYGPGSRIIVTTRKEEILHSFPSQIVQTYGVEPLNKYHALQLFCKHAFRQDLPKKGFYDLCRSIANITEGLPLALVVTGSFLFQKEVKIWEEVWNSLSKQPHFKVMNMLMISYSYLQETERDMFLDIACSLNGLDSRKASYMWEDCKLNPHTGIKHMHSLSMVKIGENHELRMHDQLVGLGRKIVHDENENPGERSRLWVHDEAFKTLMNGKGTQRIKSLNLSFNDEPGMPFTAMEFKGLSNLRFLKLDKAKVKGSLGDCLSNLRWLYWPGCSQTPDLLNLTLEELVILDLSSSQVTKDQSSWSKIMEMTKKLKVLDLRGCANLTESPNFPPEMKLKILSLEGCSRLMEIHPSIGYLEDLTCLNLKFCSGVVELPKRLCLMKNLKELWIDGTSVTKIHFPEGSLEQLETLSARGCKYLAEISPSIGNLKSLIHLALDGAIIEELPESLGLLAKLEYLSLTDCEKFEKLPDSVGGLICLREIVLSKTQIYELPCSFNNLVNLRVLKMERCFLREFPDVVASLEKLEVIDFSLCAGMRGRISTDIKGLLSLRRMILYRTNISILPPCLQRLSHLEHLNLLECNSLERLPWLPSSLTSLHVGSKKMREVPNLSYLNNLKEFHFVFNPSGGNCKCPVTIDWLPSLRNLESLKLTVSKLTELPGQFPQFPVLRDLTLSCEQLMYLPKLPSRLSRLCLKSCKSLGNASLDISHIHGLSELEVVDCDIAKINGLENLEVLQILKISSCCIESLEGLQKLSVLRVLSVSYCDSLKTLPSMSNLKMLQEKEITYCELLGRRPM